MKENTRIQLNTVKEADDSRHTQRIMDRFHFTRQTNHYVKRYMLLGLWIIMMFTLSACGKSPIRLSLDAEGRAGLDLETIAPLSKAAYEGFLDRRYIRVVDDEGILQYIDVDNSITRNPLNYSKLTKNENGYYTYEDENGNGFRIGIDVSSYQGQIDWPKVKAAGVDYAMIRVGFRGYGSSGKLVVDEQFANNIKGAKAAGVPIGLYFYSQAVNYDEGVEEAQFVLQALRELDIHSLNYPIVFDSESAETTEARTYGLSKEEYTQAALGFCNTISKAGYRPMIYSNKRWYALHLDLSQLADYDWWYAQYDTKPNYPYRIRMWQYSAKGSVDGITGNVDLNIEFVYSDE